MSTIVKPDLHGSVALNDPVIEMRGPRPRRRLLRVLVVTIVILAAVGGALAVGLLPRLNAKAALDLETEEMALPSVATIHPTKSNALVEVVLPGNVQAFRDAPIYARTNGYLKRWLADIGASVKAGQLLAEIDTPEVDEQLQQARADLATAEANYRLAVNTAERWKDLLKTDSVSQQETDEKISDAEAQKATVDSARFNVRRLEEMQSFQRIYAPFDGTITVRNTDFGALISVSNNQPGRELFRLADTRKLRVYVNVPQTYAYSARPGVQAELNSPEKPGKRIKGTIVRTAESIDSVARTLLAEVDVVNPNGGLLPGAYVEVHLKLPGGANALLLPVNTLLFRSEGLRVAVVEDGRRAVLKPIRLGRDLGSQVEVIQGLNESDSVIVNPSDSLMSGAEVKIANNDSGQPSL